MSKDKSLTKDEKRRLFATLMSVWKKGFDRVHFSEHSVEFQALEGFFDRKFREFVRD